MFRAVNSFRFASNALSIVSRVSAVMPTVTVTPTSGLINKQALRSTTILCVRRDGHVVMAGDGQVSQGPTVMKGNAKKVRRIGKDILVGFAGSTADALTLLERLEKKLEEHPGQLMRACVELAKAWRSDKYLRRLEASLLVADATNSFELTGNGDVLEPEHGVISVGSGGSYALAAATALMDQPNLTAEEIVRRSMKIAGDICVYTNHNLVVEKIEPPAPITGSGAVAPPAPVSSVGPLASP